MIPYAPRTGTKRQIREFKSREWGWLVGPEDMGGPILAEMRHALDNGAWPAHAQSKPWDAEAFRRCYRRYGPGADFVVAPDIVMGGQASLDRTREWMPELMAAPQLAGAVILIAVQDGMVPGDIIDLMGPRVGIFLGGSTEWKLATIRLWGAICAELGCWYHVGRVNSSKRIALCGSAGATSFDGSAAARFAANIPRLDAARHQRDLYAPRSNGKMAKRDPRGIPWHWTWEKGKIVRILYMQPEDWDRFTRGLPPRPHGGYSPGQEPAAEPSACALGPSAGGKSDSTDGVLGGAEPGAAGADVPPTRIRRGGLPAQPDLL